MAKDLNENYEILMHLHVIPDECDGDTWAFSPCDLFHNYSVLPLTWPLFFNYDIDGEKLFYALKRVIEAYPLLLGKLRPHFLVRTVVVVNTPEGTAPGVPFFELQSDMTIAEAIKLLLPFKSKTADFPEFRKLPFFMDTLGEISSFKYEFHIPPLSAPTNKQTLRKRGPLLKLRLTHFKDGCCLNIAVQHILSDAIRYIDVIKSLSLSYCDYEVDFYYHNRKHLYPDMFARNFAHLGEKSPIRKIRRELPDDSNTPIPYPSYPKDSSESHVLYFSKKCTEKMKEIAKPFLSDGRFVATNDVLSAFFWMLQCELLTNKTINSVADLNIDGTYMTFTFDLISGGYGWNKVFPHDNYTGNAFILQYIGTEGLDVNKLSLEECFSKLAWANRQRIERLKRDPVIVADAIMFYFVCSQEGTVTLPVPLQKIRMMMMNVRKAPFDEIDFGEGLPVWSHAMGTPLANNIFTVAPGPLTEEINVFCVFLGSQIEKFKRSVIRKMFADEMKDVFEDYSMDEFRKLITPTQ